ncbi:MAG: ribbon-helix-helix protein, CopG family [Proteobacteria bacterium]|nr:ribbon-helix-helix protein, CopG family [Pseudomonadota bacterium]
MVKVLISLPEEALKDIDQAAQSAGMNRSNFIREAALKVVAQTPVRPIDRPEIRKNYQAICRFRGVWKAKPPTQMEINKWKERNHPR